MDETAVVDFMMMDKSMLLDILLAIVLGFAIGLEREMTNKWAGLRTHILVCLGSCVFTLLSIHAFPVFAHSPQADPARIAAQVLTGIGFIGGGTVLRHGNSIYGLTTAATLWVTASIGMACGCSFRTLAVFSTVLAVGVLVLIRIFEKEYIHRNPKNPRRIKVSFFCANSLADEIYDNLMAKFKTVHEISEKTSDSGKIRFDFTACILDRSPLQYMHNELKSIKGVENVSMQELYD